MAELQPLQQPADDDPAAPREGPFASAWKALKAIPVLGAVLQAVRNYIVHQSGNQAGSVAFSSVLSMFPLLLLVSAAAAYVGHPGDAATLAGRILGYTPPVVQQSLKPVVDQVLMQRNQALLAIGIFATVWTASSGMQAVRTALNRAYGVEQGLAFWKARLKVTALTVLMGTGTIAAFSSVVVMPYLWLALREQAGVGQEVAWLRNSVRYGSAFVVLSALYALLYAWLPDTRQRVRTVLPGALLGAALWLGAAAMLSYALRSAGKLVLVYGGFAGLVATLVFLYISAVTLIFGAEFNAVLGARAEGRRR